MIRYLARRLALLALTLLLTSLLIFFLTQLLPGDVARLILGREASEARVAQFRAEFGLDDPPLVQYGRWLGGFLTGDWGRSFAAGNPPVRPFVLDRLGNSLVLAAFTLALSVPLGLLLGLLAAVRHQTWIDNLIAIVTLSVVGLPEFVSGIVLVNVFALGLGWLPATTIFTPNMTLSEWLRFLILPALSASLALVGYIARLTRVGVLDELSKPYVRTARLKGLPPRRVLLRHVLPNALLPVIAVVAISTGWLIGGIVVIENVYNYPGIGSELVRAVLQKNLPVIQAITTIIVFVFAVANFVADALMALLNPRVRLA
ncbi:MAG: ABC transporter permease [Anaerolineae bacterium]|nr:ABC transporter permease [Anaerolineae bacterium]